MKPEMKGDPWGYVEDELERRVVEEDHEEKHIQKRSSFLVVSPKSKERPTCRFTADRTWNGLGPPKKSSMQ